MKSSRLGYEYQGVRKGVLIDRTSSKPPASASAGRTKEETHRTFDSHTVLLRQFIPGVPFTRRYPAHPILCLPDDGELDLEGCRVNPGAEVDRVGVHVCKGE